MRRHLRMLITATAAAALLGSGLATGAQAEPPQPGQGQQPAAAPDLDHFALRPATNQAELGDRAASLSKKLTNTGVQKLMSNASRKGSTASGKACNPKAVQDDSKIEIKRSICFDPADAGDGKTSEWTPQGTTSVADAQADQEWGDGPAKPFTVSWYNGLPGSDLDNKKGARISFVNPDTGKYQHVLLVYPKANGSYMTMRYKQVEKSGSLHAGGIVWYGNYLYVADTHRGFRVFNMKHILDLKASKNGNTSDKSRVGVHGGKYYGHGYRYVMPQVGAYTNTSSSAKACEDGATGAIFSYVGLDRTGANHLTTGEYCNKSVSDNPGRVATWPLNAKDGKPKMTGNYWKADSAYALPAGTGNYQGAVRWNSQWYLSRSNGENKDGRLYRTAQVTGKTGTLKIDESATRRLSMGPEDISYWGGGSGLGGMWTVSEHPGKRMIYSV